MSLALRTITFDAHDPHRLAGFWAAALDWMVDEVHGEVAVQPSAEDPWDVHLVFLPVADGMQAKSRCHPDLHTDDLDGEVARLVGLGATLVARHQETSEWVVLRDPEGNEFCVVDTDPDRDRAVPSAPAGQL